MVLVYSCFEIVMDFKFLYDFFFWAVVESPASSPLFAAVVHECCMAWLDATTPLRTSSNVYMCAMYNGLCTPFIVGLFQK